MKHARYKAFRWVLAVFFLFAPAYADTVTDVLEIKARIAPLFELSLETAMSPLEDAFDDTELLKPSKNDIIEDKDLEGKINLGVLVARKKGDDILPLISEYRVRMRVRCETNLHTPFHLTQTLVSPIAGETTGERFPEKAFVCAAEIAPPGNDKTGKVLIEHETPVLPEREMEIYRSGPAGDAYMGNVIDVYFWISDRQEDIVPVTQRADTYRSTLIVTMVEL